MGAILAKFRKAKSTGEVLERLEEKITQIEKYTINTQERKRRIVGNFLAISIGIYVIAFIVFYFVYFPPTWRERIIYSVPLFLFPFVIILLRRLFTWYFERKLNKNSVKLTALHAEKKKILEQVMDKETYKVAVKLLARYGDKNNGQKYAVTPRPPAVGSALALTTQRPQHTATSQSPNAHTTLCSLRPTLSNSALTATPRQFAGLGGSPAPAAAGTAGQTLLSRTPLPITPQRRPVGGVTGVTGQELRRRTPFPIINQQSKGVMERIVDVLIGDGPQDRFAMICKECYAHNGMAFKEDFEYTTFRCAFCNALNPARKTRPVAPRLSDQHLPLLKRNSKTSPSSTSSSESDAGSENDEPTITAVPIKPEVTVPRIQLIEPTNTSTAKQTQQYQEIGAGDGPGSRSVAAAAADADIEAENYTEKGEQEMDIENNQSQTINDLDNALHDAEMEELNRLEERFAKMYSKSVDEEQQTEAQDVGGKQEKKQQQELQHESDE